MQSREPIRIGQTMHHPEYGKGIVTSIVDYVGYQVTFGRFEVYFSKDEYWAAHEEYVRFREHEYQALNSKFHSWFEEDFLNADQIFSKNPEWSTHADFYLESKLDFLRSWFIQDAEISGHKVQNFDAEQLQAIGSVDGNYQVIARAGSGKTTVTVYRAYFLIKHCKVKPDEILLLAFNRDAAKEIRKRILFLLKPEAKELFTSTRSQRNRQQANSAKNPIIDVDSAVVDEIVVSLGVKMPFAMTFHALARAIVQPAGAILYDDPESKDLTLSSKIQELVDEALQDEAKAVSIRQLMSSHFKADWESLLSKHYQMSKQDLLLWRRSLPNLSIDGLPRRSYGEKLISDFLFEHSIEYQYERNIKTAKFNYKPDFTIHKQSGGGIAIEYFGLVDDAEYRRQMLSKRDYWSRRSGWKLIEVLPQDIAAGEEHLASLLSIHMQEAGITLEKLSDEQIWERIKNQAILRYTQTITSFVTRCRQIGWSSETLRREISGHEALNEVESLFLNQATYIYQRYEMALAASGDTDFSAVMADSSQIISKGITRFNRKVGSGDLANIRFLFVDEFQDFSFNFNAMIQAILANNRNISIFCVGDDWQAINGFAGSDLQYFKNFSELVPKAKQCVLSTNYRSDANIVDFGNSLMLGLGVKARANKNAVNLPKVGFLDELQLSPEELSVHGNDLITPALLRLVESQLRLDRNVVLLTRTNSIPYSNEASSVGSSNSQHNSYLNHIRSFFSDDLSQRITISTAHKYKGRERDSVIIIDASDKKYPLIHPDWIFTRILGVDLTTLRDDDQRLFYVAATRAIEQLFLLTDTRDSLTPYLQHRASPGKEIHWKSFSAPITKESPVVVHVTTQSRFSGNPNVGTLAIKDFLKSSGYKWSANSKLWHKGFSPHTFSLNLLKSESWAGGFKDITPHGIEVVISLEPWGEISRFGVLDGNWNCQYENSEVVSLLMETKN